MSNYTSFTQVSLNLCCKWQAKQIQLQMKLVSFDAMTGYHGYTIQKNVSALIHKYGLNTTEFCETQLNKFSSTKLCWTSSEGSPSEIANTPHIKDQVKVVNWDASWMPATWVF